MQVNKAGIEEIRKFLIKNLKAGEIYKDRDKITEVMLNAWAMDAEKSMHNGNPPMIEISATGSKTGWPVTLKLADKFIDKE